MKPQFSWIQSVRIFRRANSTGTTFAEYLQGRRAFLERIGRGTGASKYAAESKSAAEEQSRLMSILESTGSRTALSGRVGLGNGVFEGNAGAETARDTVTIRQMLACSMHLGHATARWNPKMAPYIFGERAGIHIINLERTLLCLRQACAVLVDVASKGGTILFVGTGAAIQRLTYECAQDCGQYYVSLRWIGGTITNRAQVLRSDRLAPDMLVVLDPVNNKKAVAEAHAGNIPVIAICDTDCDPTPVTYPIPANDDAYASVELVARTLSLAAAEGRQIRTRPLPSADIIESATSFIDRVFSAPPPSIN